MAALSTSGFSSINLITDSGGPSSGNKLVFTPPTASPVSAPHGPRTP